MCRSCLHTSATTHGLQLEHPDTVAEMCKQPQCMNCCVLEAQQQAGLHQLSTTCDWKAEGEYEFAGFCVMTLRRLRL